MNTQIIQLHLLNFIIISALKDANYFIIHVHSVYLLIFAENIRFKKS